MGINTNMLVEAFHRVFKYNYLKGKHNRRVDNCLFNLLKYTRDKLFERLIKLTKGKSTNKLKTIQDRHNNSKGLKIDSVQCVDESKWLIKSEKGSDTYTVTKQHQHTCTDTCQLRCTECSTSVCIHQYTCTCHDYLIQHTICKHIHLLQHFLSVDTKQTNDIANEVLNSSQSQDFVPEELGLLTSHLHMQNKVSNDIASLKQGIKRKLLTLSEQIESCTNKEALQQLDKQINAAQNVFSSLQKHPCLHHKMQPISNTPANKNIEKQKGFRSTKKKAKTTNKSRLTKPSKEDILSLFPNTNDPDDVQELLSCFGVSNKLIKMVMETNKPLSEKDIHLDKKHPSEEALNFNIISIKQYLDQKAWEKVVNSFQKLQEEWRCSTCNKASCEDMIMCDSCSTWHHWECVKIKSEHDEWYCQICENLNQDMSSN
ncbi:uncharacterized protein LOC114542468 isoform X2 [Dendronephthya gigantea]|uniref:uncharacterized protein LOC114531526 n=1 Tax=Dendronephthya gigantea TaxID=151771 RepID=UPI0010695C94|nr:uncharacterized protein LOC114531526 [Dendronephthya gigantea]XP_028409052.1 uncharacterized protein LOC114531635 isoform X2 [Dendronephthya gigantea]XP_028417811.1 uncharacterized protein LOC114542468 isoform X2 [Dendronephthya gigantea]